jgi:hypothetical protein
MGTCMSTDPGVAQGVEKHAVLGRRQRKRESQKQVMEALANEGKRDVLLAMTPGRMFRIGASDAACLFTQQGRKGTNQDAMLVWEVRLWVPIDASITPQLLLLCKYCGFMCLDANCICLNIYYFASIVASCVWMLIAFASTFTTLQVLWLHVFGC